MKKLITALFSLFLLTPVFASSFEEAIVLSMVAQASSDAAMQEEKEYLVQRVFEDTSSINPRAESIATILNAHFPDR